MMSVLAEWRENRANALDHALAPVLPVLIVVLGLACLAGFLRAFAIAPLHVSLDPNEGWNAYHASAALNGRALYAPASSFTTNNYPPLSFFVVGLVGAIVGDNIVAGRLISLASFLCICAFAALAIRRMSGSWRAADFGALLLGAILLLTSDYVGMNDPQLLAHAIQLAGLLLLLREPRTRRVVFGSAALFVLGGFVKHNLFALPLTSLAWLFLFDRRNALRLLVCGLVLSVVGLLVFRISYGFDLMNRLNAPRLWSLSQMTENFAPWLEIGAVPLFAVLALLFWRRNDRMIAFVALYAAIAILSGVLLMGGAGVDVNAMFDADIALALGVGLALERLARRRDALPHIVGRAVALGCVLPLAVIAFSNSDWRDSSFWFHPMRDETVQAARDISFLRAHHGPAICESLAYCYWAGKSAEVDVFNLDQQFETHARKPTPFVNLIAARHFAAIELDETMPFPFPPDVQAAISRNYRLDHTDDEGNFFVPAVNVREDRVRS